MATKAQKTKVGLFLIICGLLIVAGLMAISGYKHEELHPYSVVFNESVLGLSTGGLVEYLGVPVGKIQDIYVDENNMAHVDMQINPTKVTLREGVEAHLAWYSIATGTLCISLSGGDSRYLAPGSEIPARDSVVKTVSTKLEVLISNISEISASIKMGLEGMGEGDIAEVVHLAKDSLTEAKELLSKGGDFVDSSTVTLDELKASALERVGDFKALVDRLNVLIDKAQTIVKNAGNKIDTLEFAEAQQEFNKALKNINSLSDKLGETLTTIDTVANTAMHEANTIEFGMRETLRNVSESLDAFRELAEYLQQDPSALLRGKGKKQGGR